SEILKEVRYSTDQINAVQNIILKKKIKVNSAVQKMENTKCLEFLAYQYEEFYRKHPDLIVNIIKKFLLKMDAHGHSFALSLPYSPDGHEYIKEALKLIH